MTIASFAFSTVKAETIAQIKLFYKNQTFVFRDSYIHSDNHLVTQEIFDRKINATFSEKIECVQQKLKSGADYKRALLYCFPLLEETVNEAISTVNKEPVNSQMRFDPSKSKMFVISREKQGVEVQEDRLYMDIYFALILSSDAKVKIPVRILPAEITTQDNIALTKLRSRYSTDFSQSSAERKHNIQLALSKISGAVIHSGEVFSFNETVGSRTIKNGYKEAKIIKNGRYEPGVGGGVCQASTTLYNAALLADLNVIAVNRHSLKSSYELPSFDAMVNSGTSDLKIRNDGSDSVYVKAYASDGKAFVEVYGSKLPYVIKRKSEVTFTGETPPYEEVIDEKLKYFSDDDLPGTKKTISYSYPEVHSNGYLQYYDEYGKLLKTKKIRTDVYNSVCGIIAVMPQKQGSN